VNPIGSRSLPGLTGELDCFLIAAERKVGADSVPSIVQYLYAPNRFFALAAITPRRPRVISIDAKHRRLTT
jgi:hypothetical protein